MSANAPWLASLPRLVGAGVKQVARCFVRHLMLTLAITLLLALAVWQFLIPYDWLGGTGGGLAACLVFAFYVGVAVLWALHRAVVELAGGPLDDVKAHAETFVSAALDAIADRHLLVTSRDHASTISEVATDETPNVIPLPQVTTWPLAEAMVGTESGPRAKVSSADEADVQPLRLRVADPEEEATTPAYRDRMACSLAELVTHRVEATFRANAWGLAFLLFLPIGVGVLARWLLP